MVALCDKLALPFKLATRTPPLQRSPTDVGGSVGRVEHSTDSGDNLATGGRDTWTCRWTRESAGLVTIQARAVDHSANSARPPR